MEGRKPLIADGNGVRFELVRCDALRRKALLLEQLSQQPPRQSSAASALNQEVENLAFVVDGPPESVSLSADDDHHFIEVQMIAGPGARAAQIGGDG